MSNQRDIVLSGAPCLTTGDTSLEAKSSIDSHDFLPIQPIEKFIIGSNAIAAGLGTTAGVLGELLWFLTNEVASGGFGVAMTGAAATSALSAVSGFSLLTAVPIIYLSYRELNEGAYYEEEHKRLTENKKEFHKKIFFELLRIRALCESDDKFFLKMKLLTQLRDLVELENLASQVNSAYCVLKNKKHDVLPHYDLASAPKICRPSDSHLTQSVPRLLQNQLLGSEVLCDPIMQGVVDINYSQYFKSSPPAPIKDRPMAACYGITAGLNMFSFIFGTGWAFGSLAITAGIAAAIPIVGWIILLAGSVFLGIVFGLGMGICKQNNLQRREKNKIDFERNEQLLEANEQMQTLLRNMEDQKIQKENAKRKLSTTAQFRRTMGMPNIVIHHGTESKAPVVRRHSAAGLLVEPLISLCDEPPQERQRRRSCVNF